MKVKSIKKHLRNYSIHENRKTTINHAFASAIAINDSYSEEKVKEALLVIGINPEEDLVCFYCDDKKAKTWDHVISLVNKGKFQGYGHQVGNLVPSCKDCNSAKGGKDWAVFLESQFEGSRLEEKKRRLQNYMKKNVTNTLEVMKEFQKELEEYYEVREEILRKMKQADEIANRIKEKVIGKISYSS